MRDFSVVQLPKLFKPPDEASDPSSKGDMVLKTASQCVSVSSLCVKRGALTILFLPAVATAFSGGVATGNYAKDLGYIMGFIDAINHRATLCAEESPSLNAPLASAVTHWNQRNLFVIGEVNDRINALDTSLPKNVSQWIEQGRRKKFDQMRAQHSSMSRADAKETCDALADDLNTDLSNLEDVLRSPLESVRGHTRSGDRLGKTPD